MSFAAALMSLAMLASTPAGGASSSGDASASVVDVINRQVRPGQTLSSPLRSANLDPQTVHQLVSALDELVDLKRVRAGHQLRVVRVDGRVERLEYRRGPLDEYLVLREGNRFVAQRRPPRMARRVERFEFDVETTLYEAAQALGTTPIIAMALADALGWELDLTRDARLGDRARVLIETYVHKGRIVKYGDVLAASYLKAKGGDVTVYRYPLPDGERAFFFADGRSAQRTFLKSPVGWAPVSSRFGYRMHPLAQEVRFHDGVDFAMPEGTPVRAVSAGLVTFAGYTVGGGNMVCVMHDDDYESCYLHLSRIPAAVRPDAVVMRKQVIGYSGNTGASTKPHLHFTLRHYKRPVDPLRQSFPRAEALPAELRAGFQAAVNRYAQQLGNGSTVPTTVLR